MIIILILIDFLIKNEYCTCRIENWSGNKKKIKWSSTKILSQINSFQEIRIAVVVIDICQFRVKNGFQKFLSLSVCRFIENPKRCKFSS